MAWWRHRRRSPPSGPWRTTTTAFVATVTAQIAQGVAPWQQSWTPGARRLPEHLVSGHAYRGVPALHLSVAHTAKGYRGNRRATATEIQALGGQVRPGEQDHAQAHAPLRAPQTPDTALRFHPARREPLPLSDPTGGVAGVQHRPPAGAKHRRFWEEGRSGLCGRCIRHAPEETPRVSILSRRQRVLLGRHQQNQAGRVRDRAAEAVLRACSVRRKQDSSEDYASKHSGCLRQMRKHVPDLLPATCRSPTRS